MIELNQSGAFNIKAFFPCSPETELIFYLNKNKIESISYHFAKNILLGAFECSIFSLLIFGIVNQKTI